MTSTEPEIRDVRPRGDADVTSLEEAFRKREASPEIRRSAERLNRATVQRIVEDEAARCLPTLDRAELAARWARQLTTMAEFAGDQKVSEQLRQALARLVAAA